MTQEATFSEVKHLVEEIGERQQSWGTDLSARVSNIEAKINRPGWGTGAIKSTDDRYFKAVAAFARTGDDSEIKTLSVGSDAEGGFLVVAERAGSMIQKLWDMSPMRQLCRTEIMGAGDAWEEPLDLGQSGAVWPGERQARPSTGTPTLGMLRVQVHEIYALQNITQRLLDDSYVNLGEWIEGKIVSRFDISEGEAFATGDGVNKPRGFLTYPTDAAGDTSRPFGTIQHRMSGHASQVTADALRDMVWGLRTPYRKGGAAWQMNSNTAGAIDKLKDSTGQYLWRNNMQAGEPDTLLGYPVFINEDMADVTAGAFPVAFANWKLAYLIVDKLGIRFLRDPFSDKPNVGIYAYRRVGGGLQNSEALKLLKIGT